MMRQDRSTEGASASGGAASRNILRVGADPGVGPGADPGVCPYTGERMHEVKQP